MRCRLARAIETGFLALTALTGFEPNEKEPQNDFFDM
jgi:hypothetical protein